MLDIDTYNELEIRGRVGLSVRALQVGAPITFEFGGYPHRVHQEAELASYVDVFGGGINGEILREFYKRDFPLTRDEVELVRAIGDLVAEMTAETWGRRIRPWVGPLSYIAIFRMITHISRILGRRLTDFEVGPGAGYLGCLLALAGHRYIATDIAQNQYLWQNRLFAKIAGSGFLELAGADPGKPIEIDSTAKIVHVPWWIYAAFYKTSISFRSDIFVSEKNLGEMAREAMDYTFAVAREMLAGPKGVVGTRRGEGLFLFSNIGWGHVSNREQVNQSAARTGFKNLLPGPLSLLVHEDSALASLSPHTSNLPGAPTAVKSHPFQEFSPETHVYNPSGRTDLVRAIDHLPLKWSEAATGYEWLRFMGRISDIPVLD